MRCPARRAIGWVPPSRHAWRGHLELGPQALHASPLPAALLQEAAVGYLTGPQRTKDTASAGDLTRLGQAARDRGLYRHAAGL